MGRKSILAEYSEKSPVDILGKSTRQDLKSNAIVYTYPSGDVDIICASDKVFIPKGWENLRDKPQFKSTGGYFDQSEIAVDDDGKKWLVEPQGPKPAPREKGKKSDGDDMLRSMRRARAQLRRLALSNEFDYFVTLTLDPAKIDRFDGAAVTKALSQWCSNMVKRHGLRYILVPEQHKDGAFHFHGFMAGEGLQTVDSGVQWDGRPVLNLPQWGYGFTTAQRLYGEYSAAVGYCCKYIGKQEGQRPLGRWYYSGGALQEPPKEYACLEYRELQQHPDAVEFEIPGSKLLVIHTKQEG